MLNAQCAPSDKGFNVTSWWGLLAPKGTPQEVINALNAEINKGLKTPAMQESLLKLGADPLGGTPEQFKQHIHAELARWKQVVLESGAKVD
ncbi:tripartite tricarboxylate transporter substrate-binding protein [Ottowia thiooxydans]|uniref:Tripartite-type tricarboxylate transporter receptor subunit TctC n=1 Tax=Ottowia thiooxydans TaxID=219182 RepID=A0ABV2Q6S3_9BURK